MKTLKIYYQIIDSSEDISNSSVSTYSAHMNSPDKVVTFHSTKFQHRCFTLLQAITVGELKMDRYRNVSIKLHREPQHTEKNTNKNKLDKYCY